MFNFALTLQKGTRNATTKFNIKLSDSNDDDYFQISPISRGMETDIIFEIKFNNSTINILDYTYLWTIDFFVDSNYLNGKNQNILKVSSNDLHQNTSINMKIAKGSFSFSKTYQYINGQPPYGGACNVSPSKGESLVTTFIFIASNWKTANEPLSYGFFYKNSQGNEIQLRKFTSENTFVSNFIPVGNSFSSKIQDSKGNLATSICYVTVVQNSTKIDLKLIMSKIQDVDSKLQFLETYSSSNAHLDDSFIQDSLSTLKLAFSSNPDFKNNEDKYLSQMQKISNLNSTKYFENLKNLLTNMIDNSADLAKDTKKIGVLNNIINNIYPDIPTNVNNNTHNNYNLTQVRIADAILDKLNTKVLTNLINGQQIKVNTDKFVNLVGKISVNSLNQLNILDDGTNSTCQSYSPLCLNNTQLKGITDSNQVSEFATIVKYNKNNILSINQTNQSFAFSQDSVNMTILLQDHETKRYARVQSNQSYHINLKMPKNANSSIDSTSCLQYDQNNNIIPSSCNSWYDYKEMIIVCICKDHGLTVNMLDDAQSNLQKLAQFPNLTINFCN